jgi:hypothetical protein
VCRSVGSVRVLGEVGGDRNRVGPEPDAHLGAVGGVVNRESSLAGPGLSAVDGRLEHVHHADETGDELVGGLLVDLAGRADLFQAAAGEDDDAVADFHRLLLVVGDEDRGDVEIVVEADQPFAQFLADLGVDGAERFVEEEDAGLGGEGAGDGHALPLSAGQLVGKAPLESLEVEESSSSATRLRGRRAATS